MIKILSGIVRIVMSSPPQKHLNIKMEILEELGRLEEQKVGNISYSYKTTKDKSELTIFPKKQTEALIGKIKSIMGKKSYREVKATINYKTLTEKKIAKNRGEKGLMEITIGEERTIEIN